MLQVTCAIIKHENNILICQRSAQMKLPLKWEFPGGKIKTGESKEECLQREILEELGIDILITQKLTLVVHHYDDFSLCLYPFLCEYRNGTLRLEEHAQAIWVKPENLMNYDWAAADIPVVRELLSLN